MARLVPDVPTDSIRLKPELDVAHALVMTLGPEVVVYHSYPWLRPLRNDRGQDRYLREGEADFAVLLPEGLLVLEVKGGEVRYDPERRLWSRFAPSEGWRPIKEPFEQARTNMHALRNQITERAFARDGRLPCAYGYAVVFPDCEWTGTPPPGAEASVLLTSKDLPALGRRAQETLGRWNRNPGGQPLQGGLLKKVRDGLSPAFRLIPLLSRQVAEQEERLVRLTDLQDEILRGLGDNPRVLVAGTAGSGKTMLAVAHARRQATQGRQVLFLCFNRGLAEWLRAHVPAEEQERVVIRHFAGLCAEACREEGVRFQPPRGDEEATRTFFRSTAPQLLEQAIDRLERRFDAIVVDEAQDFAPDWWLLVELLNARAEEGPLYMFYDPDQNLFVEEKLAFPDAVPYRLPCNCRNTREIAETCGRVLGKPIRVWAEAPAGQATRVRVHEGPLQRRQAVDRQVREWLKGGLRPEQIAILSPWRQVNSSLDGVDRVAGQPLVADLAAWRGGRGILFATVRGFKGLEADALVIVDVPAPGAKLTASDSYVACSRAKHLLCLVASEPLAR
jgi:hypothetical protein